MTDVASPESLEWLEADGCGGFASGTAELVRTRRYQGLLLVARRPPTERVMLVNGFEAYVTIGEQRIALSSQRYAPDVIHPDGATRVQSFSALPWPRWLFRLTDGLVLEQQIVAVREHKATVVRFGVLGAHAGLPPIMLELRPLLSGRDYHALHHENGAFCFDAEQHGETQRFQPYGDLPAILSTSNGRYRHEPTWYRNFCYREEQARGLDALEDLASPGVLSFELSQGDAVWLLRAEGLSPAPAALPALQLADSYLDAERVRRQAFGSALEQAGDSYVVKRGEGKTIIAGYPWFADWGRDTFIALRGLCLATGRLDDARSILCEWARVVSQGMLPNRFADNGEPPEYNSVDASLWYVIAVHDWLAACARAKVPVSNDDRTRVQTACDEILHGYTNGTRHGIVGDHDGLLYAGEPGVQLTWMDAKVGDWVVTPRSGKPVEIQALWLNALAIAAAWSPHWQARFEQGQASFTQRFWNESADALYDVIDIDRQPGSYDASFRPNQIFAVGGLPRVLVSAERAQRIVQNVEARLLTPLGLRSLAPGEPHYAPRYRGGVLERDGAYHQGTVWPWLLGPFVEAFVRVNGDTRSARRDARQRFVAPLLARLEQQGGQLCEIADAAAPHTPRGCPFQAWSVAELLRLDKLVLSEQRQRPSEAERDPATITQPTPLER